MISDAQLLAAARNDPAAFRELYQRYAGRIHGFLVRRCRDEDAAYDLAAETFAQAWLVRERFRDEAGGSAAPWLFAIARNVVRASVRKHELERRACARLGLRLSDAAVQPDESWLDGLDDMLADLPASQRDAIELRVFDDLAYEQVAAALGTTPAAARVRVHRGLSALRARLGNPKEAQR
jgi:RNA polymerase sigma-70 factor (ECF subfamily)